MTIGALANILSINDKLVKLMGLEARGASITTNTLLQDAQGSGLGWTDTELQDFLENTIRQKFGVIIERKNIKSTLNGSSPTVGDLSIAVSAAIQRQHRPRAALPSK